MMLWQGLVIFRISSQRTNRQLKGSKLKVLDAFELILRTKYTEPPQLSSFFQS